MKRKFDILFVSILSNDIASTTERFERVGFVPIEGGTHPYFGTDYRLLGTQAGGVLVLSEDTNAPGAAVVRSRRERFYHLSLQIDDSVKMDDFRSEVNDSEYFTDVSEPYATPWPGFVALISVSGRSIPVEFVGSGLEVKGKGSPLRRVESIGFLSEEIALLADPFASIGLTPDRLSSGAEFPGLGGRNSVLRTINGYIELNEPLVGVEGVMHSMLGRLGGAGIFGLNVEPADMAEYVQGLHSDGIRTNTQEPVLLMAELSGEDIEIADVITIHPADTDGGRVFVLTPRGYPRTA